MESHDFGSRAHTAALIRVDPAADNQRGRTWIELPNEPERPAKIFLQGRCSEVTNLTLDGRLAVVDTVEDLLLA